MDITADIKAAEGFAKALQSVDPAKLVDTARKFMSSTRTRIEAGEKRIAGLETRLSTALDTIDKLSGISEARDTGTPCPPRVAPRPSDRRSRPRQAPP